MNPITVKSRWGKNEDMKVIKLVQQNGKNWGLIAKEFSDRTGKQIRERYLNKLDP